jgi:hypothetical protein
MESFSIVSLRELKISEEIMFSREKLRPKIVRLARRTKVEALNIYKNLSIWEKPGPLYQHPRKQRRSTEKGTYPNYQIYAQGDDSCPI